MSLAVNLTMSMPSEMLDKIEQEADDHGMNRSEYIRALIREAESSPFEKNDMTELKV